jgi:hypothetical protein
LIVLLKQRALPLPAAIEHTENIPGFRNKHWIAHPLQDADRPAVNALVAQIETRMAPPRREIIVAMLMRLAVGSYPEALKDADGFGIRISDMADDLVAAPYSELHVAWALAEWRRTEKWFPKTSELCEKLLHLDVDARVLRRRCRVLLGQEKPFHWEIPEDKREAVPLSPERKAELAAKIHDGPMADKLRDMVARA